MIKTTIAAIGMLGLLSGVALAAPAPAPNDVGVTGMGGGVYYNPYLAKTPAPAAASNQPRLVGTTGEGGGIYQSPAYFRHG